MRRSNGEGSRRVMFGILRFSNWVMSQFHRPHPPLSAEYLGCRASAQSRLLVGEKYDALP